MKKVNFNLNTKEKSRILEMHQSATRRQYLMEEYSIDDKKLALEIVKLLDQVTGRFNLDFEMMPKDVKEMLRLLGDLHSDIVIGLIPQYNMPRVKDSGWDTLEKALSNSTNLTPSEVTKSVNEFTEKIIELIKSDSYFPNDDLSEVKQLMINFEEQLDQYEK